MPDHLVLIPLLQLQLARKANSSTRKNIGHRQKSRACHNRAPEGELCLISRSPEAVVRSGKRTAMATGSRTRWVVRSSATSVKNRHPSPSNVESSRATFASSIGISTAWILPWSACRRQLASGCVQCIQTTCWLVDLSSDNRQSADCISRFAAEEARP